MCRALSEGVYPSLELGINFCLIHLQALFAAGPLSPQCLHLCSPVPHEMHQSTVMQPAVAEPKPVEEGALGCHCTQTAEAQILVPLKHVRMGSMKSLERLREVAHPHGNLVCGLSAAKCHLNKKICRIFFGFWSIALNFEEFQHTRAIARVESLPLVEHQQLIELLVDGAARLVDGGNDEHPKLSHLLEQLHNQTRIDRVEGAGRLVKQQDGWQRDQLVPNTNAPELAPREPPGSKCLVTHEIAHLVELQQAER
mmetsp:Transcript_63640/g.125841  ORF Transcript_63640/g.125841 Transcript_63640/m.125841 type:complete len:254 (-) Transcript_63640:234-995(-)